MNQKKIKKFIKSKGTTIASYRVTSLPLDARAGQFDEEIKEKLVVLLYLIERIFVLALTRFPGCTQLRVNHAIFLLDKMKSTQQALSELEIALADKPSIDEQFMIFRYKKLIEDSMLEARKITGAGNGTGNLQQQLQQQESANEITSDSAMKEIVMSIE